MFERFTEEGRQVVVLAQEESRGLRHDYIGTEHILLGLLRQEEADESWRPLQSLGVSIGRTREAITRLIRPAEEATSGQIPFTPRSKKVLELSLREALGLAHDWIGPEHILLGLVRENEGVGARVLLDGGMDSEAIRDQVIGMLGSGPRRSAPAVARRPHAVRIPVDIGWLDGLYEVLLGLTGEIRHRLGREPDLGDLLLAVACARETLAGEALAELGVDLDVLTATLERIREQREVDQESSINPDVVRQIRLRLGLAA